MSGENKKIVSASKAVGAALVALSGFVPMPNITGHQILPMSNGPVISGGAHAATLPIPLSGSAMSGIKMANPASLKFGTIIGTAIAGTFAVKTDGGIKSAVGAVTGAGQANGAIGTYTALVAGPADITIKGLGNITLTGAGQKVSLNGIFFKKQLDAVASLTITNSAGTSGKALNTQIDTAAAASVKFGGTLKWTGLTNPPVGAIPGGTQIVITISY